MAVEESEKSSITGEEQSQNSVNNGGEDLGVEDEELIEGEEVSSTQKLSKEISATHPLENSWTFCSIRPIYTFSSAEEFWSLYNNIPHPSKLAVGADFHCFKYKIEPKWEDPVCANGGKWTIRFPRGKSDTSWLYTLLAMIGEQFDHGDEICGAVINVRSRQEKIALWTKNATNESTQVSIGQQWKKFLDSNETIGFIFHEDAKNFVRAAKNKYTV
ncbi:translation initiation factor eIF4E [Dionaea muscipula]